MNIKTLIKLCNVIAFISIALLIYWLFIFVVSVVFGLKVFQANLTEIFGFSVLGILAMMVGALILNIMLNLTRIANRDQEQPIHRKRVKIICTVLILLFPLLAGGLFLGDYLTVQKKKQILLQSVERVFQQQNKQVHQLANYQFTYDYLTNLEKDIVFLEKMDTAFRNVSVIVPDQVDQTAVYLHFEQEVRYSIDEHENITPISTDTLIQQNDKKTLVFRKVDYIYKTNSQIQTYLDRVFQQNLTEFYFSGNDGHYVLYYPYQVNGKTIAVFLFSDYQSYGKIGS